MAEVSGYSMALTVDTIAVGYSTDFSVSLDVDAIDVTNRSSTWWRTMLRGMRSWSISFSGFYVSTSVGRKIMQDWYGDTTDAVIAVVLTLADGTITLSGNGILTNLSYDGPHADGATYSGTIEGTAGLTQSAS